MLIGRKRPHPASDRRQRGGRGRWLAGAVAGGIFALATGGVIGLAAIPVPGAPPPEVDPAYDGACGSCHFAFSPSLSPAWVWDRILGGLDHHFGLRASVDPGQVTALRAYLDANAAGRWDTLPARVFAARDPADPLRITATPVLAARPRRDPRARVRLSRGLGQGVVQFLPPGRWHGTLRATGDPGARNRRLRRVDTVCTAGTCR